MCRNKIYCLHMTKPKPSRVKIIGKWCLAFLGFPLAYVVLPVSCCIRNPASMVLYDDDIPDKEKMAPVGENIAAGLFGLMSLVCCCGCFCGNCVQVEPKDW